VIRGGRAQAIQGGDIIVSRYPADLSNNGTYPETLNVFGSAFSSGNSVLSYGIRPVSGAAGYESTSGGGGGLGNVYRAALEVGVTGGGAYPGLALYTTAQTIASQGTAVPVTELFNVNTNSMVYSGGNVGIGTVSPTAKLHIFNALDESIRMEGSSSVNSPYMSLYRGGVRKGYIQHAGTDLILRTEDASGAVKLLNSTTEVLRAESTGVVTIPSTTSSTSTGTGALTVGGGVGIAGALNVGGGITAARLDVSGGIKLTSGGFNTSTFVNITDTASSTSTGTGALIVAGGVGVAGALYAAGITSTAGLSVTSGTVSLPSNSVSLASVAQIAATTILGNSTASAGNVTALSAATVKTLLGLASSFAPYPQTTAGVGQIVGLADNAATGSTTSITVGAAGQTWAYINIVINAIGGSGTGNLARVGVVTAPTAITSSQNTTSWVFAIRLA
jgi:hypothetical protein